MRTEDLLHRTSKDDHFITGNTEPLDIELQKILKSTPIGSRVCITNIQAPVGSSFRHENTMKIGNDLYAALGFNTTTFTLYEIMLQLAQTTTPNPDVTYVFNNIFVSSVQYLGTQNFRK